MPDVKPKNIFPKRFLWGASTAAHQTEGGNHNQWTVWELENAKARAAQAEYLISDYKSWDRIKAAAKNPSNYVSSGLADHYSRYLEDFDLLEKMNMNSFRFSIEWSRVEPTEGAWDAMEVAHYKDYISELKRRGIEPIVTLFHFSLPVWFSDMGGFEHRSNVKYFVRFAEKMISELGINMKYIITVNEPEVYAYASYYQGDWPPAVTSLYRCWRVMNNLVVAHKRVAKLAHSINRRYKLSIAKNSGYFYPGDDAVLSRLSTRVMQYLQDDYLLKKVVKSSDFIGINYYQSYRVYGYRIHNPQSKVSDMNWDLSPGDIQFVLERLHTKYRDMPILITENGLADATDELRKWWLTQTIIGMQNAIKYGVKLEGYLHWSLIDNFEWAYGKWPRFGLAEVDYRDGSRQLRPSARWFGSVISRLRKSR